MSDQEHPSPPELSDDLIARLLAAVGPRRGPSEMELVRLRRAAVERWQHNLARQRLRRRALYGGVALAASLLVATLAVFGWRLLGGHAPVVVATVEQASGAARLDGYRSSAPLAAGAEVISGSALETGPAGRMALRLTSGASLRLGGASRIALLAADRVELEHGTVYVDSGAGKAGGGGPALEILTALGTVSDVGTRFEVRRRGDTLRVRVRDGRVAVDRGDERHEADAGWQLLLDGDAEPQRAPISVHGEAWAWVLETAPPFDIEGRPLGEFLDWVGAETGWRIALPAGEADALRSIVLHGSIEGLSPADAPDLVLPGCGVEYTVADGTLSLQRP